MVLALAVRVAVEVEEFDRTLPGCRFRGTDEWMPAPGEPKRRSFANARRLYEVASLAASALELGPVPRAASELRLSHAALKSELELYARQTWWKELDDAWKLADQKLPAA